MNRKLNAKTLCSVLLGLFGIYLLLKLKVSYRISSFFNSNFFFATNYITPEFYLDPKELICGIQGDSDSNKNLLFITFVVLAPEYFAKREEIRTTWGSNSILPNDFRLFFTVGLSKNATVNELIVDEFKKHKDILQINHFNDSYFNLTTKIMKSFKWINQYCRNTQYILRINDDVMANTYALVDYFKKIPYKSNQLYGNLLRGTSPIRDPGSKHFVTIQQFSKGVYDDYPEGRKFAKLCIVTIFRLFYNC